MCPKPCFGHTYKISAWNSRCECDFWHCVFSKDYFGEFVSETTPRIHCNGIYNYDYLTLKQLGIFFQNVVLFSHVFCIKCNILVLNWSDTMNTLTQGGWEGTPSMLGDMDVPPFWPPFWHSGDWTWSFWGTFSHPPMPKQSFRILKRPILTEFDLIGPKCHNLFGSNFQQPAAHPHQFWTKYSEYSFQTKH